MVSLSEVHAGGAATGPSVAFAMADWRSRPVAVEWAASLANDNTSIFPGDRRLRFYRDVDAATLRSEDESSKRSVILRLVVTSR